MASARGYEQTARYCNRSAASLQPQLCIIRAKWAEQCLLMHSHAHSWVLQPLDTLCIKRPDRC